MFEDKMFTDSMLETSWAQRTRRSITTLTSFGMQAVILGLLLLLPLWKTVGLPAVRALTTPVSWGAPPAPAPAPVMHQRSTTIVQSNFADNVLITPREVPHHIANIEEATAPPQMSFNRPGVPGGTGDGPGDGVWKSLGENPNHVVPTPVPAPPPSHTFRTSSMLKGNLIRRVEPVYPQLARAARIQGAVVLAATISKAGTIDNLHALSGPPLLVPAAIDAVSQWRYRPYILNSEPIEVETQITVNFSLLGN
jgi:protein TonB